MRPAALTLLLLAGALLPACRAPRFDTPVSAYESFHAAAQGAGQDPRKAQAAFAALSTPTRQALEARAGAVADASGGVLRNEPVALLFANAKLAPGVPDVHLVREEGDAATVRVTGSSGAREVRMVKESGSWRVDLADALTDPLTDSPR